MIPPAHHGVDVWLCVEPVDFRKQISGSRDAGTGPALEGSVLGAALCVHQPPAHPVPDPVLGAMRLRAVAQAA